MRGLRVIRRKGWTGFLGAALGCLVAVGLVGLSGSAHATGFTLASSVSFSQNGVSGTLDPVSSAGAVTCFTAAGTCDLASNDYIVFTVTVDGSPSDTIQWLRGGLTDFTPTDALVGVGAGNGATLETGGGLATGTTLVGQVDFSGFSGTSDPLYLTYTAGAFANASAITSTPINFTIQPTVQVSFSASSVGFVPLSIPEPATGALLLLGASGLALLRRCRG